MTISCDTSGAEIRYTLDGSEPTPASPLYTGELTVEPGVTVKARAYADGMRPSEVAEYTVEGPKKLPTPIVYYTQDRHDCYTYIENIDEYPDGSILHGSISGNRDIDTYKSFGCIGPNVYPDDIYVSCEGWIDSDIGYARLR